MISTPAWHTRIHPLPALKARDTDKNDIFKYFAPSASKLKELGFRKVGVDEIGRLTDPGPRRPRLTA